MPLKFQFITYLSYLLYIIFLGENWLTCNVLSLLNEIHILEI